MDDEPDNTGIGGLAAFQLGRRSAQESQWIADWKTSRRYPVVAKEQYDHAVQMNEALVADNRQVHALNQQLRAQNAALSQSIQNWERDYEKLRVAAQGHLDAYWAVMSERDNLEARVLNLRDELREFAAVIVMRCIDAPGCPCGRAGCRSWPRGSAPGAAGGRRTPNRRWGRRAGSPSPGARPTGTRAARAPCAPPRTPRA